MKAKKVFENINDILKPKSKEEIDKIPFKDKVLHSNILLIHKIKDKIFYNYNLYFSIDPYRFRVYYKVTNKEENAALDFYYKYFLIEIIQPKNKNFIKVIKTNSIKTYDNEIYSFEELVKFLNKLYD